MSDSPEVYNLRDLKPGDMFQFLSFESIADEKVTFMPSLDTVYIVSHHELGRQTYTKSWRFMRTEQRKCVITWLFAKTNEDTPVPNIRDMYSHYTRYTGEVPGERPYGSLSSGRDSLSHQRGEAPVYDDTAVRLIQRGPTSSTASKVWKTIREGGGRTHQLVVVTVAELGFSERASLHEIYSKAEERGLRRCSVDVVPRLHEISEPSLHTPDKWIMVSGSSNDPLVLTSNGVVQRPNGDQLDEAWAPERRFMFVLPQ